MTTRSAAVAFTIVLLAFTGCDRDHDANTEAVHTAQQAMQQQQAAMQAALAQQQQAAMQAALAQQQAAQQAAELAARQAEQARLAALQALQRTSTGGSGGGLGTAATGAPPGYPADLPFIPGGTMRSVPGAGPVSAISLAYTIPAPTLQAQLSAQLAAAGWTFLSNTVSPRGSARMRIQRGATTYSISIFSTGVETGLLVMRF